VSAPTKICEKMGGATLSGRTICLSLGATLGAISLFLPHNMAVERGRQQEGKKGKKGHARLCGRTFWAIVLYLERFRRNLRHIIWQKSAMIWLLAAFGDSLKRRIMCSGARQAREDTCCPHGTASPACTTLARTVLRRLAAPPRMPRYPCGRPHLTAMPVATDMTTPRWRAPVTGHVGLPPGPASRGEPARSGGARDQDAPGQTCGASPS